MTNKQITIEFYTRGSEQRFAVVDTSPPQLYGSRYVIADGFITDGIAHGEWSNIGEPHDCDQFVNLLLESDRERKRCDAINADNRPLTTDNCHE